MSREIIRLFKGQGFMKNAFPNNNDKAEARRLFDKYVQDQKVYEMVLNNEDVALLTDTGKNIKQISLLWGFLDGGPRIIDHTMSNDEVEVIDIVMTPPQLNDALGKYTLGGLLMGGIGGAIAGSIIDSFRGPERSDVSIRFEFGKGKVFNTGITYEAIQKKNVRMTADEIENILKEAKPQFKKLKRHFPGKVKG